MAAGGRRRKGSREGKGQRQGVAEREKKYFFLVRKNHRHTLLWLLQALTESDCLSVYVDN